MVLTEGMVFKSKTEYIRVGRKGTSWFTERQSNWPNHSPVSLSQSDCNAPGLWMHKLFSKTFSIQDKCSIYVYKIPVKVIINSKDRKLLHINVMDFQMGDSYQQLTILLRENSKQKRIFGVILSTKKKSTPISTTTFKLQL